MDYILINNAEDAQTKKVNHFSQSLFDKFCSLGLEDIHFISEIKINWQDRFWEMYLACSLNALSFKLSSKNQGPDLLISTDMIKNKKVWIEAVCSSKGNGNFAVEDLSVDIDGNITINATYEKIILRLLSSLKEKNEKFTTYRTDNFLSDEDPCVIAINAYKLRKVSLIKPDVPHILRALFPINDIKYNFSTETIFYDYSSFIEKGNIEISKKIFSTKEYEFISAVIYSEVSAYDSENELGYDYITIHNPFARNPINNGFFKIGKEISVAFLENEKAQFQNKDWNSQKIIEDSFK